MGKLPLKEILTVLLISHLSTLIAGQLGKPKEPVLGAEANWYVELGKLRSGTEPGRERKQREAKPRLRGARAPAEPQPPREGGGAAPRISPCEPGAAINTAGAVYSTSAGLAFSVCLLSCRASPPHFCYPAVSAMETAGRPVLGAPRCVPTSGPVQSVCLPPWTSCLGRSLKERK